MDISNVILNRWLCRQEWGKCFFIWFQIEENLIKGARENRDKRRRLIELMMSAKTTLQGIAPNLERRRSASSLVVENLLIKEGLVQNTEREFTERIEILTKGECQVLVSGEHNYLPLNVIRSRLRS